MLKKRVSIVISVVAIAMEAVAIVLLLPTVFGPAQTSNLPTLVIALLVIPGLVLALIAGILRRQLKPSPQP